MHVHNRYSPVFLCTAEWQQLEFMKHACALQVPCFNIQEREKMSLLCSVCQTASSFVPKYAPCLTESPFLNYTPKGKLDTCKSHFSFRTVRHTCMGYVTFWWRKMTKGACAIPTRVPALRNLRCLLMGHVWAEPFRVLELTELFIFWLLRWAICLKMDTK